jgi:hypothetical protein
VPSPRSHKRLQGTHGPAVEGLGDVFGIAAFTLVQQPLDEAACMGLILVAAKQGRVPVQETIQLGLERPQLLPVHERSLQRRIAGEGVRLVPFSPFA